MSGRKLRQVLRERGGKLLCGVEFTNKAEITPSELKAMEDLLKSSDQMYTQEGRALKERIRCGVSFYKSLSKSKEAAIVTTASGYIPGVDSFLDNFIRHYSSNKEFGQSLIVNLMKAYVAKVEGVKNPRYG